MSDKNGKYKLWIMDSNGTNQHEMDIPQLAEHGWTDWSPNGEWFYYAGKDETVFNIYKTKGEGYESTPVTTFLAWDFGLPEEYWCTKFDVTEEELILPLESRSGEIFVLDSK